MINVSVHDSQYVVSACSFMSVTAEMSAVYAVGFTSFVCGKSAKQRGVLRPDTGARKPERL